MIKARKVKDNKYGSVIEVDISEASAKRLLLQFDDILQVEPERFGERDLLILRNALRNKLEG